MDYKTLALTDIICLAIVIIMYIYSRLNRKVNLEQSVFDTILILCMIMLFVDSGLWLLDGGEFTGVYTLLHVLSVIFYLDMIFTGTLWLIYCDCILLEIEKLYLRHVLYLIPSVCAVVLVAVNFNSKFMYYYDEQNFYHRGPYYFLFTFILMLYIVVSVFFVIGSGRKKTWVQRHDAYSLLLFTLPPIVGMIVQSIFYGLTFPMTLTVSMLIIYSQRQAELITLDHLTGINNRRVFERYLTQKIFSSPKSSMLFVLMLDMDNFKCINDSFGHSAGDEALAKTADILRNTCSSGDCIARMGGDEFVIAGIRNTYSEVDELVKKINQFVDGENNKNQKTVRNYRISVSIGYAVYNPDVHAGADELVNAADMNMYENKKSKKAE